MSSILDEKPLEQKLLRLEEENRRLRKVVEELSILNDLSRVISSTMDPQAGMETIVKRSVKAINAEQGAITLVEETSGSPMKTLIRASDTSKDRTKFHTDQNILGWMIIHKKPRKTLLERGVKFLEANVLSIDLERKTVTTESAHTFYTIEGAQGVLREFNGGDLAILIPKTPFKCPPAPMPTAGPEMGQYISSELALRGIGFHPK